MNYYLTIYYFEYVNNVLLKENSSKEHKLKFKDFEDAKKYALNQAYSYFDDVSRVTKKRNMLSSSKKDKIYSFCLQELSGEAQYEVIVYLIMEE